MGVGRGIRGLGPHWIPKFATKTVVFLNFEWVKPDFITYAPHITNFQKIHWCPLGKILPPSMALLM